jgi:hypothetical protein
MECFPNADIATVDSVNNTRRPIGPDEVRQWIGHLNEVFESSTDSEVQSEVLLRITGLLTPEATQLLREFFGEKGAFYASADIIVFPGKNSGVRCIRILGVRLDLDYERNDEANDEANDLVNVEEGNESDESDEIDPYMSQDPYASFRPSRS